MAEPRHDQTLGDLAAGIRQAGWRAPLLLLLTAASPLAPIGQQLLLLSQPLLGAGRMGHYARLLCEPDAWETLATLLDQEPTR